jgi:micrococcal nuclease
MYQYRAALIRVVDGDTMHLAIDLGLDIATRMTVRIHGVNAPETGTAEGKMAKEWAMRWFNAHTPQTTNTIDWPFTVDTIKDKREKYGRYLARVTAADGHVFNDDILAAGHAVPYNP